MLAEANNDPIKQDINLSRNIHAVEKEFGVIIDMDYPFAKLISQIEYLHYLGKEYEKERIKNKRKKK